MKNSYSPHDFVDLLKNMGYPAEFDCDYHGAGVVATSAEQSSWKWHILFETTDEFEVVDKMLLIGRRLIWNNIYHWKRSDYPYEKICARFSEENELGIVKFHGGYSSDDWSVQLQYSIDFTGGVNQEWLRHQVKLWERALLSFGRIVDLYEEPDWEELAAEVDRGACIKS
jgi:hypothetical protein